MANPYQVLDATNGYYNVGWFVDLRRCIGCRGCQVACQMENNLAPENSYRRVVEVTKGSYPDPRRYWVTMACNHCEFPACMQACPNTTDKKAGGDRHANALFKDPINGIVSINQDQCVGCRYCQWACPYGAPQFNETTGKMEKCHFCEHRTNRGLEPACAAICPGRALYATPMAADKYNVSSTTDRKSPNDDKSVVGGGGAVAADGLNDTPAAEVDKTTAVPAHFTKRSLTSPNVAFYGVVEVGADA